MCSGREYAVPAEASRMMVVPDQTVCCYCFNRGIKGEFHDYAAISVRLGQSCATGDTRRVEDGRNPPSNRRRVRPLARRSIGACGG